MRPPPSIIWYKAAAKIARKESESTFSVQQSEVLNYLWSNFRDLYLGSRGQSHAKETILQISRDLSNTSTANKRERFDFLARALEQGNLTLPGWDVPLGPVYIKVSREENFARQERFRLIGQAEKFVEAFCSSIENTGTLNWPAHLGQLLVSAVFFGGLLDRKLFRPFLQAIQNGHYYQEGPVFWVELAGGSSAQGEKSVSDQEISQGERRLVADHLTRLLIYRHHCQVKERGKQPELADPWKCVSSFMNEAAFPKNCSPGNLSELAFWAFARYLTMLPHFLVGYASGKLKAVSLPVGPWLRTISGMTIPVARPAVDGHIETAGARPKIVANAHTKKSEQELLLSTLLKSLRFNKKSAKTAQQHAEGHRSKVSSRKARHIINNFMQQNRARMSVALQLLLHWALRLLQKKVSHLELRQKRSIRPTSADRYLSSIGYALLYVCGDLPLHDLDPQELESLYEEISLRLEHDNYAMNRLRQFHGFMQVFYGAESMEWGDLLGEDGKPQGGVNANIISADIYQIVLQSLGWGQAALARWQRLHLISLILLFRCGLRPSELQALRLKDVQGVTRFELLIRNSRLNNIKTNSGIRRIPLSDMLLKEELEFFMDYFKMRIGEDQHFGDGLLLAHPVHCSGLLSDEELFEPIRKLLRSVTHDETLRLYHLRHSLLTWTNLVLLLDDARFGNELPGIAPAEGELVMVRSLFNYLYGNEATGRKAQYLLAMVAGHASPETTNRHYCHLLDLLLWHHLNSPVCEARVTYRTVCGLTGLQRSVVYDLLSGIPPNIHPLHNVTANEAVKYRDELRHPQMAAAAQLRPVSNGQLEQTQLLLSWEEAINILLDHEKLAQLRRDMIEWEFAAAMYEAVRGMDGRRIKSARKAVAYVCANFSERHGGISVHLDSKALLLKTFLKNKNMPEFFMLAVFHPAKRLTGVEAEECKRHWINVLGIPANQVVAGEHVPAKHKVRSMFTIKITVREKTVKKIRAPRMSTGFMLAANLLNRQLSP